MHETLRREDDLDVSARQVRVVRVSEVASVRRSSPGSAVVALVRPDEPLEAVRATLAGADVVLPCTAGGAPSAADLDAASSAARMIAHRASLQRGVTRHAAHEVAGNASAVAMAAELLTNDDPLRAGQLRGLAAQGAQLAWDSGRVARSGRPSVESVDVGATVRSLCRVGRAGEVVPVLDPASDSAALALVNPTTLVRTMGALFDNARAAGCTSVVVQVDQDLDALVRITVTDDGRGLPDHLDDGVALRPFERDGPPGGDGLGLTEAAEFAADHGGDLSVTNRSDGRGTVVSLRLPAAPARPHAPAAPTQPLDRPDVDWSISRILEGIARRDALEESLEALVEVMEQRLPGSICSILLYDEETSTLNHGAGRRLPAPYRAAIDGVHIGPNVGSCGTAAFTRGEVIATDISADPRWVDYRDVALAHGLESCWSTPILDVERGVVLGTFAVYHASHWSPDASAAQLVLRLTHVAGVAIGTAALHGQLVESEARFRGMFETTGVGIALVGADGRIQQANSALAQMSNSDVVGRGLAELLHPDDVHTVRQAMAATLDRPHHGSWPTDDRLPALEVRLRVEHGSEPMRAALSGSLIRGQHGPTGYFCIELFDLTERRRVVQAQHERAVAEAANRAKSDLLALVSHELRTPLNAVIGFAQLLGQRELALEQQREGVGHILDAGRHLLRLINDLIDLTGAETGQLKPGAKPILLNDISDETTKMLAGLAGEQGVDLVQSTDQPAAWVAADRQRLRQVLLNLVGNGIKFTPSGGSVTIGIEPGAITVSDTGPGIDPEHVEHLFTPFHRAGDTGAEGSGLGLALSQRLTVAMGGQLSAETEVGVGTTVRVELPRCSPASAQVPSHERPAALHALRGRVLYVEDNQASQQLLVSALSCWPEVKVDVAVTLTEARTLLAADLPDVLIADVELPDGNGWDLLRALSDPAGAVPPTIVVTAGDGATPEDLEGVEVFGKPLVIDDLLDSIGRLLLSSAPS